MEQTENTVKTVNEKSHNSFEGTIMKERKLDEERTGQRNHAITQTERRHKQQESKTHT